MKLPEKIIIDKHELKVILAVIIFFLLILWFFPRFGNFLNGKGFIPNEDKLGPTYPYIKEETK